VLKGKIKKCKQEEIEWYEEIKVSELSYILYFTLHNSKDLLDALYS
jgi:hypothetical protein